MDNKMIKNAVNGLISYMTQDENLKGLSYQELKSVLIVTGRTLSKYMGSVTLQEIDTLGKPIPEDIQEPRNVSDDHTPNFHIRPNLV